MRILCGLYGFEMWIKNSLHYLFCIILYIKPILGSNWAQASGEIQQNTVFPSIPAPDNTHWQARFGHATVIVPISNTDGVNSVGTVFLLGGDTYSNDFTQKDIEPGKLDYNFVNGYKNDVWTMDGTEWYVKGDIRLESSYDIFKQKIPTVTSKLEWKRLGTGGAQPPRGVSYDDWIICEDYFNVPKYKDKRALLCTENQAQVQWSPRRNHAAVFFNGYMYIMGGRCREFEELTEDRSVGGVIGPRVKDVPDTLDNKALKFTAVREASTVRNDVWRSQDGITWNLVTPGCKAPQSELLVFGNPSAGKVGLESQQCQSDNDCYGAEKCIQNGVCACPMWTSREQHAAVVFEKYMYVSGGYSSTLYSQRSNCGDFACGNVDASGYRRYLSDIWRSSDGEIWTQLTFEAFPPRGGHQMLVIPQYLGNNVFGKPYIWVFGGRGGDNTGITGNLIYYNDIWTSELTSSGSLVLPWTSNTDPLSPAFYPKQMPWEPRTGHTVVLEPASPANGDVRSIYIIGGAGFDQEKKRPLPFFFDDVWVWRPELYDNTNKLPIDVWKKDYTDLALYSQGVGEFFGYYNETPAKFYLTPDSDVSYLRRFWLPSRFRGDIEIKNGMRSEIRPYITLEKLQMLNDAGIYTIRDLATANKYQILKLRGFDFPQIPLSDRMDFYDICDARQLAIAVVDKCSVKTPITLYDGYKNQPWMIKNEFGGPPPPVQPVKWHDVETYVTVEITDPVILTDLWDACTYNPNIQGFYGPNVNGLGYVSQISTIRDPLPELQELFCRQNPGPRAYHSALYYEERVYIFGGKQGATKFKGDTWYRDAQLPTAKFVSKPASNTYADVFEFGTDEPGCVFEYRVWDPYNYIELRPWTPVVKKTIVGWLDWRVGGPGNGMYQMFVRAVDPAGNRDERYVLGRNVYEWYYLSPIPSDIIAAAVMTFLALCFFGYLEYRRRVKKAAMERYAMKRMRRKFKAMQRDIDGRAVDWRSLYMESKEQEIVGQEKKKDKDNKKRDKKAEKREKEKQKREKEREKIKKKLKGDKEKEKKEKVSATDGKEKEIKGKESSKSISKDEEKDKKSTSEVTENVDKSKDKTKSSKNKESSEEPKYKDYETGEGGLAPTEGDETGTKQRKSNKRYKEYEIQEQKKDM